MNSATEKELAPYPGLRAYRRDESMLFFGREGCVDDMVDRLAEARFLAVLGASGSGKSSLVRTGLLDALKLGLHPAGARWRIVDCQPGGRPIYNLARALLESKGGKVEAAFVDALTQFLRRGPLSVVEWVRAGNFPENDNVLIIVDQFEELFRYGDYAGREQAEAFVALLLESARADARIEIVITMRSEFLGACALIPGLAEQINRGLYLARRMTRDECREAIEGPAGVVGFDIEPRLVTRILNDLSGFAPWENDGQSTQIERLSRQADQLPLMQHALSRLWQRARLRGSDEIRLTLDDYVAIGELRGAIDQHAEEVVAGLSDAAKPLVRRVFRALIAGTNLSDAVRKPLRLSDLVAIVDAPREPVVELVEAFRASGCSFLRPGPPQALEDSTIIDISHESLIRQWSRLATWLAEEAQANSIWSRLSDAAERHARGEGEKLSGVDLATALDWWQREKPTKGWAKAHRGDRDKVEKFLNKSRDKAQAARKEKEDRDLRESRRLKAFAAIASVLALLSIGAAGLAWRTNVKLDEKVAELDRSNALLTNEQAKSDAANKALTETNANLQATLAKLDRSNSQLKEQQAQTETANKALTETNARLEVARAEAVAAGDTARKAQLQAEERAQELQAANERSLNATDNFVISRTDVLMATSGVDLAATERSLIDGKAFLSKMTDTKTNPRRYSLVSARMGLRAASVKFERGLFEDSVIEAVQARQELARQISHDDLSEAEAIEYAATYRLEAQALLNLRQGDRAAAAAVAARDALDAVEKRGGTIPYVERAKNLAVLSTVFYDLGRPQEGLLAAKQCLDEPISEAAVSDSEILARAVCHLAAARYQQSAQNIDEAAEHARSALKVIERIPPSRANIPIRNAESQALVVLANSEIKLGNRSEARNAFARAIQVIEFAPTDLKQRPELRRIALSTYNSVARMHLSDGEYDTALTVLRQGAAIVEQPKDGPFVLDDTLWNTTIDLAKEVDTLYAATLAALEGSGSWRSDKEASGEFKQAVANRSLALDYLQKAQAGWCPGCELMVKQQQLNVLVAERDVVSTQPTPEERYSALAEKLSEVSAQAQETLNGTSSDSEKAYALGAWLASVEAQPDNADQVAGLDAAQRIMRLTEAERQINQFLKLFPDSWRANRKLGQVLFAQSLQFKALGNNADVLKTTERAADLYNREAIQQLIDWYSTGSGPVAKDSERSKAYEAILASRSWGTTSVRLRTDLLWTDEVEEGEQSIVIEDRTTEDDNVVRRLTTQLLTLNGMKLSAQSLERLQTVDQDAIASDESFLDMAVAELSSNSNSPEWIAKRLSIALISDQAPSDVSKIISNQWPKSGGQDALRKALTLLLAKSDSSGLRQKVLDRANDFQSYSQTGWGEVSATFLDALIATSPVDPAVLAQLYAERAEAYEKAEQESLAEVDRLISLLMDPGNSTLLNSLGFRWANDNRNISASLELLARAVSTVPDNPYVRDSLGWAYLQSGNLEKALELLESASREAPEEAEILAHLAEVYMRLGRKAEAAAKFSEALGRLATKESLDAHENELVSFILERQQLLVDSNAVAAAVIEHAASLLRGTSPLNRLGWSTDEIGIAIRGFDPVAYFTKQHPELGSIQYVALWSNSLWLFSSAEHRDLFLASPEKYAPVYGGFCAFCVAAKHKLHGNPAAWAVHKDRLYIHQTLSYRESWLRDPDGYIRAADEAWPSLVTKDVNPDARSAFTNRIQQALNQTN